MYILFDGNFDKPEIEISDSPRGLIKLGEFLVRITKNSIFQAEKLESEFYPESLESVLLRLSPPENGEKLQRIKILLEKKQLIFEGSKSAFSKLGMSLLNYFNENSKKGEHFHLDYVEDDPLLAPTNCSLIFLCRD